MSIMLVARRSFCCPARNEQGVPSRISMREMPPMDLSVRLLVAAGLGAAIGLEREYRRKPAGLRTNILIAVGSALFTVLSVSIMGPGGSGDRIAAQVVTGIGFLGGGGVLAHPSSGP